MHHIGEKELGLLRAYQPKQREQRSLMKAAVAMILRDTEQGTEVLLMQRSFHPKDPWSGQMAFPGGKIESRDSSVRETAMREAYEEVGVELGEQDYIGRLDDLYGLKVNKIFSVHVACFVFKPTRELELKANEEVADMVWLPLAYLNERRNAHGFVHPSEPSMTMPAVMIDDEKSQILWGLSLRMMSNFYAVLDRQMAVLSEAENAQINEIEKREMSPSLMSPSLMASIKRELSEEGEN